MGNQIENYVQVDIRVGSWNEETFRPSLYADTFVQLEFDANVKGGLHSSNNSDQVPSSDDY